MRSQAEPGNEARGRLEASATSEFTWQTFSTKSGNVAIVIVNHINVERVKLLIIRKDDTLINYQQIDTIPCDF